MMIISVLTDEADSLEMLFFRKTYGLYPIGQL